MKLSRLLTICFVLLSLVSIPINAQLPPTPPDDCPDCILVNDRPGIQIGNAQTNTGGMTTQSVSFARGWGDARLWFSPWTDYVATEAFTGLNTGRLNHTACAQPANVYLNGTSVGGVDVYCETVSGGGEMKHAHVVWATCPTYVEVYTFHSLARGSYYEPGSDYEAGRECN